MIGEKTMKDLKRRILAQIDFEVIDLVEQDLDLFFEDVRKLKRKLKFANEGKDE